MSFIEAAVIWFIALTTLALAQRAYPFWSNAPVVKVTEGLLLAVPGTFLALAYIVMFVSPVGCVFLSGISLVAILWCHFMAWGQTLGLEEEISLVSEGRRYDGSPLLHPVDWYRAQL
jgi:ABC-type Fe3+ transport system permease subunit